MAAGHPEQTFLILSSAPGYLKKNTHTKVNKLNWNKKTFHSEFWKKFDTLKNLKFNTNLKSFLCANHKNKAISPWADRVKANQINGESFEDSVVNLH